MKISNWIRGHTLTDLKIKESLLILKKFTKKFKLGSLNFIDALRFYLSHFELENEPEKIDLVLHAFAKKYYKDIKRFDAINTKV